MTLRISPLASALLMAIAAPALAAPVDAAAVAADTMPDATDLDTIRVDARRLPKASTPKFTAPLVDTPRSVVVIPQQVIQDTNSLTLVEALRTVPGITFGAGEGGNPVGDRPFIRGFDSQSSVFIDGVRSSGSQTRETFDIEQIEVTKGPSSAYTGRGAVGGSINMVSKLPKAGDFYRGSIGLGTDSYLRGTVDVNESFDNGVAFRMAGMFHQNDVADRGGPDSQRWGIAPSVSYELGDDTTATLSYYHLGSDDQPESGVPYNNPFAATSPNAHLNGDGSPIRVPHDTYYGLLDRDFTEQTNDIGMFILEHRFSNSMKLRNTTVYGRSTNDYVWTNPDDSQGNFLLNGGMWRRNNNRSTETRAATNQTDLTGRFMTGSIANNFSAGLEFSREETTRDSYVFTPSLTGSPVNGACSPAFGIGAPSRYWCTTVLDPNPSDPFNSLVSRQKAGNPTRITTDTQAAWFFDTIDLSARWLVNVGLRYDSFSTQSFNRNPATGVVTDLENDADFFTWQSGVVFKPTANGSIYASYGTSANPPGVDAGDGADGISLANRDLDPEESRNIELGTKWDFLDNRASFTAAVFRSEKTNARLAGGAGLPTLNVGEQRVDGFEVGLSGNVTEQWAVFGGYSHLRSEIVKTVASAAATLGNQFPNTPENSGSLWTTYAFTPRFFVGGGAYYTSKVYGNVANTKWVPGYTRFDAMASWTINRNYSVQLNVQNLTDKYYFNQAYASHYAAVAPGRSATVTFNFKF